MARLSSRYSGPSDSYWEPPDDPEECGCDGEGPAADCEGCDDCVVENLTTRYTVARRPRGNILVGDQVARTDGFSYQRGGGPRLGYTHRAVRQGYGPAHHPALQGHGWRGTYPHPLPPEATSRAALVTRSAALSAVEASSWSANNPAPLRDALTAAVALRAEVEAFLANLPDDVARILRSGMTAGLDHVLRNLPSNIRRLEQAEAAREAARVRAERAAAWRASGAPWQPRGTTVTWEGREYIVGDDWTRLVVHSDLEVGGELVDCSAVGVLDFLDPTTGRLALRWNRRCDLPQAM